jgi:hypothetical protein
MRFASAFVAALLTAGGARPAAAEPPPCTDGKALQTVRMQYGVAEGTRSDAAELSELTEIGELALAPSSAWVNQHATADTSVEVSRFCQAKAVLRGGASDTVWWRIDEARDGAGVSIRVDHCSVRHDVFQDGCEGFRPER